MDIAEPRRILPVSAGKNSDGAFIVDFLFRFAFIVTFLFLFLWENMRSAKQETESCFARNKARNKKDGLERRDYTATHEIFACKATVFVIFASHLMHLPPCDEVARVF